MYGLYQVLQKKLIDLWRKCLLKDREQRMRLTTHGHSERQMFHSCKMGSTLPCQCLTILDVSSCQKLFSHLNFLEEEPLDSLLV